MKVGTPRVRLLPAFDIPKTAQPKDLTPAKPMQIKPHPQQARIDQHRQLPSLVTPNKHQTPDGKGNSK